MRTRMLQLIAATIVCAGGLAFGQAPVITSFHGNGELTWTNNVTNVAYRVEWSPSLTEGHWHRSWQSLDFIESRTNASLSAEVPMFYRVVMMTNWPPSGMVLVDRGPFQMGDGYGDGNTNELPLHTVCPSAFWIDKFEVSKAQWLQVWQWALTNGYNDLAEGAAGWRNSPWGELGQTNHPVVNVDWYNCVKWCNARSEKEGLVPMYYTDDAKSQIYKEGTNDVSSTQVRWEADGYRLPTEAEWEKAARGGLRGHHYPWRSHGGTYSEHLSGDKANYGESGDPYDDGTTPVGYYNGGQIPLGRDMANAYGLYDMGGNVWEWCWDWYDEAYYSASPEVDPRGPLSSPEGRRVYRGGNWHFSAFGMTLRCAQRNGNLPFDKGDGLVGFRCVRSASIE